MMIGGRRACGKTAQLIKKASEDNLYILTANRTRVHFLNQLAEQLKLEIPFPVTVDELPLRSPFIKEILVDDIEDVLRVIIGKPISMASTSLKFKNL